MDCEEQGYTWHGEANMIVPKAMCIGNGHIALLQQEGNMLQCEGGQLFLNSYRANITSI